MHRLMLTTCARLFQRVFRVRCFLLVLFGIFVVMTALQQLSGWNVNIYERPSRIFPPPDVQIRYRSDSVIARRPFVMSNETLAHYGFPMNVSSTDDDVASLNVVQSLVFVTASTSSKLHVAMDAIAIVQKHFPGNVVYFYDLDVDTPPDVAYKLSHICNVIYRRFDYSKYPKHVRDIFIYAFKPIIIHEMLLEYRNIFWLDASIRFKDSVNFTQVVQQTVATRLRIMAFDTSSHTIFPATHADMYRYLPISKQTAADTRMHGAGALLIMLTQELYDNVIRWWFLCALVEDCMAPTRDLFCKFKGRDVYANCHRYDQSAINILLANYYKNDTVYYHEVQDVLWVNRGGRYEELLSICQAADAMTITKTFAMEYLKYPKVERLKKYFGMTV